jgi:ATP-dependent DNA helicase RecG
MMIDMLRVGYRRPIFQQMDGPRVRAALTGGRPDEDWLRFLATLRPERLAQDLDVLFVLRRIVEHAWVDSAQASPLLQRPEPEALDVLERMEEGRTEAGQPVLVRVAGTPVNDDPAWRFSDSVQQRLGGRLARLASSDNRAHIATDWARARGRVSSTELRDLLGASTPIAGRVLRELELVGVLVPSRASRAGRSFHYLPARDGRPS